MSTGTAAAQSTSATETPQKVADAKQLRLWLPVASVAAYWAFVYVNQNYEFSAAGRFLSRMGALLLLFLIFAIWWITRRAVGWRDRLFAIAAVFAISAFAVFVSDKSMNAFGFFLSAIPIIITAWTAWLLIARRFNPFIQRAGFCALMMLVCGYFTLVRFEGLYANQTGQIRWRWTNTSEQAFIASHKVSPAAAATIPHDVKPWTVQPGDSPEFRGTNRDGIITGLTLATDWNERPPKLLWKKKVGPAWSGMILVDGHLVTQEQREDNEAIVCYDAATGNEIWVHGDPIRFEENLSGAGPRGTPIFADGRIYTLGGKGTVNCLKPETGELIWTHDCAADCDVTPADRPQWGYSASPLVVDGLVIVFAGGGNKSVVAYQANDGKLAWTTAGGKQSYSSPQVFTLDGVKQIVMHDNRALMGISIPDGAVLWESPGASQISLPMLQPHSVENNGLVISTEPDLARINVKNNGDKWSAEPGWRNNKLRAGFNDFVIQDDYVLALDDGVLCCLDVATGERVWKKGRLGHGQILSFPDQNLLLLLVEKGEAILVSADRAGYKELGRFPAVEGKTWNSPVVVGNRLYARNGEELAAYELNASASDSASSN